MQNILDQEQAHCLNFDYVNNVEDKIWFIKYTCRPVQLAVGVYSSPWESTMIEHNPIV